MAMLLQDSTRRASLHIQSVSRLTNLSIDTIRAWEKRYAAVRPHRGRTGQRLFSADDVARLLLLKQAIDRGRSISRVATLSTSDLRSLVEAERSERDAADALISRLFNRVRALDAFQLASELSIGSLSRSAAEFADDIISPLMAEITARARNVDESTIQHLVLCESLHSVSHLLFEKYRRTSHSRPIMFLTLPGQKHSVPPLFAAIAAAEAGYNGVFVGTEVAADHIEAIARTMKAAALGLYAGIDPAETVVWVRELQQQLPTLPVFVGSTRARLAPDVPATQTLREFVAALTRLRSDEGCEVRE